MSPPPPLTLSSDRSLHPFELTSYAYENITLKLIPTHRAHAFEGLRSPGLQFGADFQAMDVIYTQFTGFSLSGGGGTFHFSIPTCTNY